MSTYTTTTKMIHIECGGCGQLFAMSKEFKNRRREDHKTWYCPNGCERHYPHETEKEELRRHLSETQEEVNKERGQRQSAENALDTARKQRNALKGHMGRIRKRTAAGTCPCCKRTFQALSTHMLKQHPGYVEANKTKEKK